MKLFKRFAAALLVGVMVLAMLTACGGSAPASLAERAQSLAEQGIAAGLGNGEANDKELTQKVYNELARIDKDGNLDMDAVTPNEEEEQKKLAAYMEAVDEGKKAEACTITVYTLTEDLDLESGKGSAYELTEETLQSLALEKSKSFVAEQKETAKSFSEDAVFHVGVAVREVNGKTYIGWAVRIDLPEVAAKNAE
mgnify:CR=1 FL=1